MCRRQIWPISPLCAAVICDWPETEENRRRAHFCSLYEGYGLLCDCTYHTHTHTHTHTRTRTHTYTHMHAQTHAHTHTHTHTQAHTHAHTHRHTHTHTHACTHARTHTHTHTNVCTYICIACLGSCRHGFPCTHSTGTAPPSPLPHHRCQSPTAKNASTRCKCIQLLLKCCP